MSTTIRIKFVSKTQPDRLEALWRPLLPIGSNRVGRCAFTFDADARDYDVLVAYEDLPPMAGEKKVLRSETLDCAPINTLLLTTEPSSIRIDGPNYLRQFGHVWTNKHPSLVKHPRQIRSTPPLRYFYGRNLADGDPVPLTSGLPDKTNTLSGMSSNKAMSHTVHAARLDFMQRLKAELGNSFDLFGRGIQPVDDKADAMRSYRYHVAVENHIEAGHFTEKLTDCFLAGCLPFYFGDPDYDAVFPERSVVPIDIFDFVGTVRVIQDTIANNTFEDRQSAILDAQAIALSDFNTLRAVARKVEQLYDPSAQRGGTLHGRHAYRRAHPFLAARDAGFAAKARKSVFAKPLQFGMPA